MSLPDMTSHLWPTFPEAAVATGSTDRMASTACQAPMAFRGQSIRRPEWSVVRDLGARARTVETEATGPTEAMAHLEKTCTPGYVWSPVPSPCCCSLSVVVCGGWSFSLWFCVVVFFGLRAMQARVAVAVTAAEQAAEAPEGEAPQTARPAQTVSRAPTAWPAVTAWRAQSS